MRQKFRTLFLTDLVPVLLCQTGPVQDFQRNNADTEIRNNGERNVLASLNTYILRTNKIFSS